MGIETYTQCVLERQVGAAIERQISWLPSRYAVVHSYVKLRRVTETRGCFYERTETEWEDGWQVVGCGVVRDARYVREFLDGEDGPMDVMI